MKIHRFNNISNTRKRTAQVLLLILIKANKFVYLNKKLIAQTRVCGQLYPTKSRYLFPKSTHPFPKKGTCFGGKGRTLFKKRRG